MRLLFCFVLFPFGSILWVVGGCCLTSFVANCFLVLRVLWWGRAEKALAGRYLSEHEHEHEHEELRVCSGAQ